MENLGFYYKLIEPNEILMLKYFLMALKNRVINFDKVLKEVSEYYQKHIETIKYNKIDPFVMNIYLRYKKLKLSDEIINCPITLEDTNNITNPCFTTECGHKFSYMVLFLKSCPLCRHEFRSDLI
jgi:dephospho-CoA kinase